MLGYSACTRQTRDAEREVTHGCDHVPCRRARQGAADAARRGPRGAGSLPGDELEFAINDDGVVEVHGLRKIRTDQAWFWTERWQAGEREASEDIASGRTTRHEGVDEMFAHLAEEN